MKLIAVKKVRALPDYRLELLFSDGSLRCFDMTPYLDNGVFAELKDPKMFNAARIDFDTVAWPNGADLCPEVLYEGSVAIKKGKVVRKPRKRATTQPSMVAEKKATYGKRRTQ